MAHLARLLPRAIVVALCLGVSPVASAEGSAPPMRVLFIGNSYTYFNHLPALVAAFGAAKGKPLEVQMVVNAGATLQKHWEAGKAKKAIRAARWDWVVLQGQSREPIKTFDNFARFAALFDAEVKKVAGARTLLFSTWARDGHLDDQRALTLGYSRLAKTLGATLAPVGTAWQLAQVRPGCLPLTLADGAHPSPAGSYLAAAVLFQSMTNQSPVGGPLRVEGRPIHRDGRIFNNDFSNPAGGGITASSTQVVLVDLSPAEGGLLQEAAREVQRAAVVESEL